MMKPVFVKGNISFVIEQHRLEFVHQHISTWGVSGLPWNSAVSPVGQASGVTLSATEHFGQKVDLTLTAKQEDDVLTLVATGWIVREYTAFSEAMGIRFDLSPEQQLQLDQFIARHGYVPTEFLRKYPRIPSNHLIQTFPTRALVQPRPPTQGMPADPPMVMDVCNLSPTGVLLSTENQLSLMLRAGERLSMSLEPRGWFPTQISFQGMVCRLVDDLNVTNGNLIRYVGIKIVRIDDANRTAFLDLLADILEQLRARAA